MKQMAINYQLRFSRHSFQNEGLNLLLDSVSKNEEMMFLFHCHTCSSQKFYQRTSKQCAL